MTAVAPTSGHETSRWPARRLTTWSLLMLVAFLPWALALGFFGSLVLMPALGLSEGSLLLMAGGPAGWAAQITMSLLLIVPSVVGLILGSKAVRRGGKGLAWLAVVLNILPILQVGLSFVDAIHMTFYPQGGWLIW